MIQSWLLVVRIDDAWVGVVGEENSVVVGMAVKIK